MHNKIISLLERFCSDRSGGAAIEYALIAGALAIAIAGSVNSIGVETQKPFDGVAGGLATVTP